MHYFIDIANKFSVYMYRLFKLLPDWLEYLLFNLTAQKPVGVKPIDSNNEKSERICVVENGQNLL